MKQGRRTAALLAMASLLAGCASMRDYHRRVAAKKRGEQVGVAAPAPVAAIAGDQRVQITALHELPPPSGASPTVAAAAGGDPVRSTDQADVNSSSSAAAAGQAVPPSMQFLYGSGEAAALSVQAYLGLIDTIIGRANAAYLGHDERSVVLAPGATLAKPVYLPCADKPLAVVFDVDETALLNLGYEAEDARRGTGFDAPRWSRWEQSGAGAVVAMPGIIEAKRVAAASKVTFVFNSNRSAANAAWTEAALDGAGLGPVKHGETLWLLGDEGGGAAKDARRWAIARKYCVVAMVGDQLGDFSDLFNAPGLTPQARRALVSAGELKMKWGHGWFILPNPVYGTALKGGIDDVFPTDKRWTDPGATPATTGVK